MFFLIATICGNRVRCKKNSFRYINCYLSSNIILTHAIAFARLRKAETTSILTYLSHIYIDHTLGLQRACNVPAACLKLTKGVLRILTPNIAFVQN